MASLADTYAMSNDQEFINRVAAAVATTSYNILTVEEDSAPDHAQRLALAQIAARDVNSFARQFSPSVAANPTIAAQAPDQAAVPDNDILFVVNQIWVDFAPPPPAIPTTPPLPEEPAA
jgi:hypothetical protein